MALATLDLKSSPPPAALLPKENNLIFAIHLSRKAECPLFPSQNEQIEPRIRQVRGQKIILDRDLAELYGVETKRLNQQVRRNIDRFPDDFVLQLTAEEAESLRLQNATSKPGRGGQRYRPFAFTEHDAIMAASVLNTPRAVEISVFVMRAFVRLRQMIATHQELANKLSELEQKVIGHDEAIRAVVAAIRDLMAPPPDPPRGRFGFAPDRSD
jgi:ATP-dependent Clp protease ATP-binding subunit ClpA